MNDNDIIQQYKKYEPFFGNWYLKRFIGEGGFAKVFEIVRNDFGSEYVSALKIISVAKTKTEMEAMRNEGMTDDEIRNSVYSIVEDTVREIQLMYKLRGNGNIVGYEDHMVIEHQEGLGWDILIKMEFLTSLGEYTRQNRGQISKRDVIKLGIDICQALEACQKYNIIHRDIKADNIFISSNGDFKLGDFGIARVIERKDMELSKKGTFTYMAPEVYKGQTYTSAVDIYSLGMVLYRLLNNNRAPFLPPYPQSVSMDDRDQALMLRMSGEKLPRPNQAERSRLAEIAVRACAYRPEDRYSSPLAMRQDLESILYDQEEMTTDEMIKIYEDQGQEASFSFSQSVQAEPRRQAGGAAPFHSDGTQASADEGVTEILTDEGATEILTADSATTILTDEGATEILTDEGATEILTDEGATEILTADSATMILTDEGATEILTDEGATEILRGDGATEVLPGGSPAGVAQGSRASAPTPSAPTYTSPSKESAVKVLCKQCRQPISRDSTFCPFCGFNQKDDKPVVVEKKKSSGIFSKLPKKTPLIAGISAAVVALAVIVGVAVSHSSNKKQEDPIPPVAVETPEPTPVPTPTPDPTPWLKNVLMESEMGENNTAPLSTFQYLGSNIRREEIQSVTFVDSLAEKTEDAWDVSEDGSGRVMAWTTPGDNGLYHVYIGGEGGVSANKESRCLFANLTNVEEIHTNGCLYTENTDDMAGMFILCTKLESVDLSGMDTSNVLDMSSMFAGCESLTQLDVSGFNTENVKVMTDMFYFCSSLTALDVSGFDTSKVYDMTEMFYGCSGLRNLDVSGFDTSSVRNMNAMFYACSSLTLLDTSRFDTSIVTDMFYMFGECNKLNTLDTSSFNTSKVLDMTGMFMNCSSLLQLDVSGFDTSSVTDMYGMFYGCKNLTQLDVSSFDTSKVTDMSYMFGECSNLSSLDISSFDTSSITTVENMLLNCSKLRGLRLDNFDSQWIESMGVTPDQVSSTNLPLGDQEIGESYHDDFTAAWRADGYSSSGWHETFTLLENPSMAVHLVYFEPSGELVRPSGFLWEGPVMDKFGLEEDMRLELYQEQDGKMIGRLRILPLDLEGDMKNLSAQDFADLFEATLVKSNILEDSDSVYSIRCEVTSSWGGGSTGLIYASQDLNTGYIYIYEYLIIDRLFIDMSRLDRVLQTITPVDMDMDGFDKYKGLLG